MLPLSFHACTFLVYVYSSDEYNVSETLLFAFPFIYINAFAHMIQLQSRGTCAIRWTCKIAVSS